MKKSVLAITFTVFITLVALAIALPTIIIKINDQYYKIRGIDPVDLNANSIVSEYTFQPALDLQGGSVVNLDVNLDSIPQEQRAQEFLRVKEILYTRLTYTRIDDFELTSLIDAGNNKYRMVLKLPINIDNNLVNLLITKGDVQVWVEDPNSNINPEDIQTPFDGRVATDITNQDFAAVSVVSDSRIFLQNPTLPNNFGLKVVFRNESVIKFFSALYSSPRQTLAMMFTLDTSPVAVQASGQVFSQLNPGSELLLYTLVPDTSLDNSALEAVMQTPPLSVPVSIASNTIVQPLLGTGFLTTLKLALLISFILFQVLILVYFRKRAKFNILLNVIFLIWAVALMKVFNVTLSLSFVWGFLLVLAAATAFWILLSYRIRTASKSGITGEELAQIYQQSNNEMRNLFILTIFVALIVNVYGINFLKQFANGLGFGVTAALIVMLLPVRALLPLVFLKNNK